MVRNVSIRKVLLILSVNIIFCVTGWSAMAAKDLTVALIAPYTGPYGFYGQANQPGVELYAEYINKKGGIKIGDETYNIQMLFIDDEIDPKKGPIAAQEAMRKGAVANIGTYSLVPPISAVLTPAKILHLGQMQQGIDLNKSKYFIGINDEVLAPVYHTYATLELWPETKTIGLLCYDWQKMQFEKMADQMNQPGTPVREKGVKVEMQVVPMGNTDFTVQLNKLHEAGVQTIITGFGPGDYALISKQAAEMDYKFHYFDIGTATDVEEFIKLAGYENAQGMAFNWPNPLAIKKSTIDEEVLQEVKDLASMFEAKYGEPMKYMGHYDWSTGHLRTLLSLYQAVGSTDPDVVMAYVKDGGKVKDFQGEWVFGGTQTWGAPVVKPSACIVGVIKGRESVYGAEYPMPTIP